LKSSFLRRKIAPDILGVFKKERGELKFDAFFDVKNKFVDPEQIDNRWALVFPKRTYLPPEYPHLQLWLLSENFVPSPKFLSDEELSILGEITEAISNVFRAYAERKMIQGKLAFGFNATPFSFIKNKKGEYYAGGQSVRVFHNHFLLIPKPKKLSVKEEELSLVYPTDFAIDFLDMILRNDGAKTLIGLAEGESIVRGERGMEIRLRAGSKTWGMIKKIDQLLYEWQMMILRAFYRDADQFLEDIGNISRMKEVILSDKESRELIILGKERSWDDLQIMLEKGIVMMEIKNEMRLDQKHENSLLNHLKINQEGKVSSFVFGKEVALRPGMGYGLLAEEENDGLVLKINPLDVLGSKGLIESSGYWFEKKIIKDSYPDWAISIICDLINHLS